MAERDFFKIVNRIQRRGEILTFLSFQYTAEDNYANEMKINTTEERRRQFATLEVTLSTPYTSVTLQDFSQWKYLSQIHRSSECFLSLESCSPQSSLVATSWLSAETLCCLGKHGSPSKQKIGYYGEEPVVGTVTNEEDSSVTCDNPVLRSEAVKHSSSSEIL